MFRGSGTVLALSAAALAAGCAPSAADIREDLEAGRTQGTYLDQVPFEPQKPEWCGPCALSSLLKYWDRPASQEDLARSVYRPGMNGSPGFLLWREARKAKLVSLQAKGLKSETLDALLSQGIPVILNLDLLPEARGSCCRLPVASFLPNGGNYQHYVLAVGRDRSRGLWVLQNGLRPDQVVSDAWLARRRAPVGGWALIAFPPDRKVSGLGAELHVEAADRAEELGQPEAALAHAEAAAAENPRDVQAWYRRGHLLGKLGRAAEAEKAYRACMALDPSWPDPSNNLALLLASDPARLAEAEALARSALDLCRKDPRWENRIPYVEDTLQGILGKRKP